MNGRWETPTKAMLYATDENFTQVYFHKLTKQWNNWFCLQKQSRIYKSSGKQGEKAMIPHSSTLAWKIPWAEEPGGLPSMGSHRVGYDWSDLAAGKQEKEIEERPQDEKPEEWLQTALLHNECLCHSQTQGLKLNAQHDDTWSQGLQEVTRDCKGGALMSGVSVLMKNIPRTLVSSTM